MSEKDKFEILDILAAVFAPGEKAMIKQTGDLVEIVNYHGDWDYVIKYLDPLLAEAFSHFDGELIIAHGKNLIPVDD